MSSDKSKWMSKKTKEEEVDEKMNKMLKQLIGKFQLKSDLQKLKGFRQIFRKFECEIKQNIRFDRQNRKYWGNLAKNWNLILLILDIQRNQLMIL